MKNAAKLLHSYLASEIDPAFALRARYLFDAVSLKKPQQVLDVGCGRGFYVQALAQFDFIKQIEGIELEPTYLAQAIEAVQKSKLERKVHLQQGSVYTLPFKSKSFDVVILSEVLEHLQNENDALREIKRVLKPGGWLICTVPSATYPFLWDPLNWSLKPFGTHVHMDIWWLAGIWAGHHRLYSANDLLHVMQQNHFKIRSYHSIVGHCWYATHFWLYGVGKNLVEHCGWQNFSRFNISADRPIARLLASIMSWPERFFGKWNQPLSIEKNKPIQSVQPENCANHFIIAES